MKESSIPFRLIACLLLLLSCILIAQRPADTIIKEIDALFEEWDTRETPGGAVVIVQDGEIVYSNAFGMASLEYDVPNTTETIFNLASVSKQITAFSLILLEQQGRLSIDDAVRKYLPEVPDFGTPITIRHLLTHTSGLRNFQSLLALAGWRQGDAMTNEDMLRFIALQQELNFPVGSEYLYCNTGFNISTAIVERVTGQSFQDWTRNNIFLPLGMTHTSYREDLEKIHKNTATSYQGSPESGFIRPKEYWTYMGNGNVYSTVGDMVKWIDNLSTGKVGGKAALERLQEQGVLNDGEKIGYALGIGIGEYRGLKRLQHGGSVGGYRSAFAYYPGPNTGIVVLSNFSSADPGGKARAVADIYLADHFTAPKDEAEDRSSVEIERKAVEIDRQIYEDVSGTYWVSSGFMLRLFHKDGQLFGETEDGTVNILAASDSTFFVEQLPYSMIAHRDAQGQVQRITVFAPDRQSGRRVDTDIQRSGRLKSLTGLYYSPELDTYYRLLVEDDQLIVQHPRHGAFPLIPISKDRLISGNGFFSSVKIVEDAEGKTEGIRVSNGRVRDLLFKRVGD